MDNSLSNPMMMQMDNLNRFERMFPDIHNRMQPHVMDIVAGLSDRDIENMTEDRLNTLSNEAVRRSNVLNDPPIGHNINTMNDMARSLIIRGMMDRDRFDRDRFDRDRFDRDRFDRDRFDRDRFDFDHFRFFPFFFFPFDEFEFRRRRREGEEEDRDRRPFR